MRLQSRVVRMAVSALVGGVIGGGALVPHGQASTFFTDPTKANVLRQYNLSTGTNLVPNAATVTNGTASFFREGVIDGSGWNDEGGGYSTANDWLRRTFTLAGPSTIGGYLAQFDGNGRRPTRFTLEGNAGAGWTMLVDVNPTTWAGDWNTGTFTPGTYSQVRYTAYGPLAGDTTFGINELEVYLASGQVARTDQGYNIFRDQAPAGTVSATGGPWKAPNGGNASTLGDANFTGNELKSQNTPGRSFVAYTFADLVNMRYGTLGGNKGQGWGGNWEVYTANGGAMPSLQSLGAADPATLQAAGWTLQYAYTSGTFAQAQDFAFARPYDYQYLAFVWDTQWPSATEFELFGLPEPGTAMLALAGCAALAARRRR